MKKRIDYFYFLIGLWVLMFATANGFAATNLPVPTLIDVNPSGAEGDWYTGAIPASYDPAKPVIVFVPGSGQKALYWWNVVDYYGINDMYQLAYQAGYRTAFVNFGDADGNERSMWTNGATLSKQLEKICAYYNVSKVSLICHSKGGIDAQAAIVFNSAASKVHQVFTLGTPHWGSPLADLAYSPAGDALSKLLGIKGKTDSNYVMQTSYMASFRSVTDTRSENDGIEYYTYAGTNRGPAGSLLFFGSLYLKVYGDNDGLVTVTSAHNPLATHVSTSNLNHYNIMIGHYVWSMIEPLLSSSMTAASDESTLNYSKSTITPTTSTVESSRSLSSNNSVSQTNYENNYWQIGGTLAKNKTTSFSIPVESLAKAVKFDLLLANPNAKIQLTTPSGKKVNPQASFKDQTVFTGATHFVIPVTQPEAGYWKLTIKSNRNNAYFLITHFDSKLQANLSVSQSFASKTMQFDLDWNDPTVNQVAKINVAGQLYQNNKQHHGTKTNDMTFATKENGFVNITAMPAYAGMYNVTISIVGTLNDGTPFARSQVRSIAVTPTNEPNLESLKQLVE